MLKCHAHHHYLRSTSKTPPILLTYEWHVNSEIEKPISTPNFYKADYEAMNFYFAEIDFPHRFSNKSLDEKVDSLHVILSEAINKFVPVQAKKIKSKCPWKNKILQSLKNKKNKEWKRFKLTGDNLNYLTALDDYTKLNSNLYNSYVNKVSSSLKSDPSSFWRFVNTKKNSECNPKLLHFGDKSSIDKQEQAEFFASFFKNSFTDEPAPSSNHAQNSQQPTTNVNEFVLEEHFVFTNMLQINTKKGTGPDGIHPLLLKNCAASLCLPLLIIFNESLEIPALEIFRLNGNVLASVQFSKRVRVQMLKIIVALPNYQF